MAVVSKVCLTPVSQLRGSNDEAKNFFELAEY
jgi:hypothetical protein